MAHLRAEYCGNNVQMCNYILLQYCIPISYIFFLYSITRIFNCIWLEIEIGKLFMPRNNLFALLLLLLFDFFIRQHVTCFCANKSICRENGNRLIPVVFLLKGYANTRDKYCIFDSHFSTPNPCLCVELTINHRQLLFKYWLLFFVCRMWH